MSKEKHLRFDTSLNSQTWLSKRRHFIKTMMIGAVGTQIPWWVSCTSNTFSKEKFHLKTPQKKILMIVQDFLFPQDGEGPGSADINALPYLEWVMKDPRTDQEDIDYIKSGIAWVEETSEEEKSVSFLNLESNEQNTLLEKISKTAWGESWMSILLNYIFEALLSDPIYGSNIDGNSWKWLEHNPGQPRPTEENKYGNFLKYVNSQNYPS